jgi:S1-C subfamily serine protease
MEESRKKYGIDGKVNGALVTAVEKDSEARDLDIVPGDVLTFVPDTALAGPDDVQSALEGLRSASLFRGDIGPRQEWFPMGFI